MKLNQTIVRNVFMQIADGKGLNEVVCNTPGLTFPGFLRECKSNMFLYRALQIARQTRIVTALYQDLPDDSCARLRNQLKELIENCVRNFSFARLGFDDVIEIKGVRKTVYEFASQNKIPLDIVRFRVRVLGWKKIYAVTEPYMADLIINAFGKKKTVLEWETETTIPVDIIIWRLVEKGWEGEEVLSTPWRQTFYPFRGELLTRKQLARIAVVDKWTLRARLEIHGWDVERAVTQKSQMPGGNPKTLLYKGRRRTVAECSSLTGISARTISRRLSEGRSEKEALMPVREPDALEIGGVRRTIHEWSKVSGVSLTTIKRRLETGWDAEKAVMTPPDQRFNWHKNRK